MDFIKYSKIYFTLTALVVAGCIFSLAYFGLDFGMDFRGGSSMEVEFEQRPSLDDIGAKLSEFEDLGQVKVNNIGENGILIKVAEKDISADTYQQILSVLKELGEFEETSTGFETISSVVGEELKNKTVVVSIIALISMLLYIAFAFRQVSRPISSFQYGISSTLMLFHDILIPLGVLAVMGKYMGVQITIPVVTALLAVIGYSINNSVVVFDRIRENILRSKSETYEQIVNKSLSQIVVRCINTSLTTLFVLIALYWFFATEENLKFFALTAAIGIIAGTYSSIFLASPILVAWSKKREKK